MYSCIHGVEIEDKSSTMNSPSATLNNTHSNIMRLLRTAKNMATLSGANGSPHSALDFLRCDSSVYDISEQRRHSECRMPYLPESSDGIGFGDYIDQVERTFGNLHRRSGSIPGPAASLGSSSSLDATIFDCPALTHRNMSSFDLLQGHTPLPLPEPYRQFSYKSGTSGYIPGYDRYGDGDNMSDISTHTVTYGNLESDSRKRKQHGDSLKRRPASAKSRREMDHVQYGYRRRQHHGSHNHHRYSRQRSASPPLSEHKSRGASGSLPFLYQDKESLRDFYLDQFRPKEGVPQWEHVDLTDNPSAGSVVGGATNCTSLVPVDDFLKSKPLKTEPKLGGGEWECRSCHASVSGGSKMAGSYGGHSAGTSRPTSATCMRCEACRRSGNLYHISEDSGQAVQISGRGQTPSQRRRAFSARPLRRQHSYDAFTELQREDEGPSWSVGREAPDSYLPPRSVSLKEKEYPQFFYSPAHRSISPDPLSLSGFHVDREPYFMSRSLYPDNPSHNPFVPTFGDDQCLLHSAKNRYSKKQHSQRSDVRATTRFGIQHSALGPPRPFNGTNGHVYEKLSSIESDV